MATPRRQPSRDALVLARAGARLGVEPRRGAVLGDEGMLLEELRCAVRAAFARLAPQCRRLLALLVSDPPLPYVRIAEILDSGAGDYVAVLEKSRRV